MAIETKKYLDSTGLTYVWGKIKDYVDNSSNTAKGKIEKIAEEVELDPDTYEYTGVYAATNSVYSDLVAAKGEIGGLKNTITDIKGLSYTDIIAALESTPEVGPNYLKFTAEEDNSTISLMATYLNPDIKYSLNGVDWTQWNYSAITLNTGDTIRMKGNNRSGFNTNSNSFNQFRMTGKISASGNIMSLLYNDNFEGELTIPCNYCFGFLFNNCSSLTTAPELPATSLAMGCYWGIFNNCSSLTTAPELPAMTLDMGCYSRMFEGCTSLTTAPDLPAASLANGCYESMFKNCTKLNYIKMLATNINAYGCLNEWVKGVASTGTFIKHPNMITLSTGSSGIPEGWVVQNIENSSSAPSLNYLAFTAEEDNSIISLNARTSPDIKYSLNNGGDWTQWNYKDITLNTGDTVYMKGNNSNSFSTSLSSYNQFKMTGKISASGNIMSLLYEDDFEGKLIIPCNSCFSGMFRGCTSLTTAPELPATTLADECYNDMFRGCTSLTTAPELPATTLASGCYVCMFSECTSLTTAPELPATTLASGCYNGMFSGCTSLTTAPELPAMILDNVCYTGMFQACTKLNYIKMLAIDISATNCLGGWVYDVASTGTFVKHPNMTSLPTGPSGIPEGWTVQDAA